MLRKKIFILFLFFIFLLSTKAFATEIQEKDIDLDNLVNEFNNHEYVKKLNSSGYKVYITSRPNRYTVKCNNQELTYVYEPASTTLRCRIELKNEHLDDLYLANSLLIDTISSMQGNTPGSLINAPLTDHYFYTLLSNDGIAEQLKNGDDGNTYAEFEINPFIKFSIPKFNTPISKETYSQKSTDLFDDTNSFIYFENLIALKYIDESGKTIIYFGEPYANSEISKESISNLISLIVSSKVAEYFDRNISNLNEDKSIEGITIEANQDSLPFTETRALVYPQNMRYVKVSIDTEIAKQKAEEMPEKDVAHSGDTMAISSRSFPLTAALVILFLVIIIILIGILKRHFDNK